jgi:hypothetical protein
MKEGWIFEALMSPESGCVLQHEYWRSLAGGWA